VTEPQQTWQTEPSSRDPKTPKHHRDWLPVAAMATAAGLAVSFLLVFFWAPPVAGLGLDFKIFFFHVPAAWVMLLSAVTAGVAALRSLLGHRPDWTAMAALDLAFLFGLVVMITGPLWAWRAWGTPWVWEPRLTTSLLCWLTFAVALLLRNTGGPDGRKTALLLAVLAAAEVPLVYLSVRWWSGSHHPPTSLVPHLHGKIAVTLMVATLSTTALWGLLLALTRRLLRATDLATESEARLFSLHTRHGSLPLAAVLVASVTLPAQAGLWAAPPVKNQAIAVSRRASGLSPVLRPAAAPRATAQSPDRKTQARATGHHPSHAPNRGFVPYRVRAKKHSGSLAAVLAAYLTFWLLVLVYLVQIHLRMKKLENHMEAIGSRTTNTTTTNTTTTNTPKSGSSGA